MLDIKDVEDTTVENLSVLDKMAATDHEQVVFCYDKESGLKAIIAIHDTTLGPSLGGTRFWNYASEEEALRDVLRLSRGMTYKAAVAGLKLGGGKAVIIGDSKTLKSEALWKKYGQFVNSLNGRYITAEDVGTSTADMEIVKSQTEYVTGLPESMGGGGDPSPVTAYGVYNGMKAAAKFKWGSDDLAGKRVVVQGIGHVGEVLVKHLTDDGAKVSIFDLSQERMDEVGNKYGAEIISSGDVLYDLDMDIYAPCALGATVNTNTLSRLKCQVIAGAANNQLENEEEHSVMLREKGIVYAPDFVINAGGLINVYSEMNGYNRDEALKQTEHIFDVTLEILQKANAENISSLVAAKRIAEERVQNAK